MHWIFKNKDQGKTAAAASLGMITLWDVEGGLPQIDKYLYSKDNHVVAGAPDLALPSAGRAGCPRLTSTCAPRTLTWCLVPPFSGPFLLWLRVCWVPPCCNCHSQQVLLPVHHDGAAK